MAAEAAANPPEEYPQGNEDEEDYISIRDALAGDSDADNFRHIIVRDALFWALWEDERVQNMVSQFAKKTGLESCAWRLAKAGERLAQLRGLEFRGELVIRDDLPEWFTVEEDQAEEAKEIIAEASAALRAFELKLEAPDHGEEVWGDFTDFVLGMGLSYPWLVVELIESSMRGLIGFALGVKFQVNREYKPKLLSEIPAPQANMTFQTREGESVEEALDRLSQEIEGVVEKLVEPIPPLGRVPERTIEPLERNARWFYRHKVRGESIRSIAMADLGSSDRRKDVYDGIHRAEELLELTPYTLTPP